MKSQQQRRQSLWGRAQAREKRVLMAATIPWRTVEGIVRERQQELFRDRMRLAVMKLEREQSTEELAELLIEILCTGER